MIDITCLSINMLSTWTRWSLKTRKQHLQCGSKVSKRNGACQRSGKRVLFFVIVFPFWAKYASFLTRKSHRLGAIFVVEMFESAVAWETDATLIDPVSRSAWNARCLNGQWHCKSDARISWGRGWFKIRARPWGYLACTHPCWGVLLSSQFWYLFVSKETPISRFPDAKITGHVAEICKAVICKVSRPHDTTIWCWS